VPRKKAPDQTTAPQEDDEMFIDVNEAVRLTGLTERCVREWIANGKLKSYRLGDGQRKLVRLKRRDVLALIKPDSGREVASAS
jgi:excisionase family DNA binding protein